MPRRLGLPGLTGALEVSRDRVGVRLPDVLAWGLRCVGGGGIRGAGDADAAALVQRVAEPVGQAGFELGEPVEALGGGVGDPGDDGGGDLVLPPGYGRGQRDEFGDVVVGGAPIIESESRPRTSRSHGADPVIRARRFSASRSFSFAIQAAAISWPYRSRPRVSMILANWAGDRCSRFRTSRPLMAYSGSPARPRRPYRARTTRRRTSPIALTASCTTWNRSTVSTARGSIRRTAEA